MYQHLVRPLWFALSKGDPEDAHITAIRLMKRMQRSPRMLGAIERLYRQPDDPVTIAGVTFRNRIGLAAGFDKQAEVLPFLQALGFGFVEVGSILPFPQQGNPRPRMFRIPKDRALCNRMGFNSEGGSIIAERLQQFAAVKRMPVGGSLGKQAQTELRDAARDCVMVMAQIAPYVDYYVGNVSSPNTPGLRNLQGRGYLEAFVQRLAEAEAKQARLEGRREKPILIKLAPDLHDDDAGEAVEAATRGGALGFINGNTSLMPPPSFDRRRNPEVQGGFSGPHLFPGTLNRVRFLRSLTNLPIIACGGIEESEQVESVCAAGADLVQIFTSLIYKGLGIVRRLRSAE